MIRVVAFIVALVLAAPVAAQVGKSLGVKDANTISEADLAKVPGVTPAIAKAVVAARPFDTIVAFNTFLLGQKLTQEQANEIYKHAFVHINLNTATGEEILLVPGAGKRMAREFDEYRPWKSYAQFEKEIGKYVDAKEVARLAQYTFIPAQSQHRDRRRHPEHSRRGHPHGARVQGISPVEDAGAVREGNRQVRGCEGSEASLALRRHSVGGASRGPRARSNL